MTESFEKWVEKVHTHQFPIGTEKEVGWNALSAFVKDIEAEFKAGLCQCGVCYHDVYLKKIDEFGLLDGDKP